MKTAITDALSLKRNIRRTAVGFAVFAAAYLLASVAVTMAVRIYCPAFARSDLYLWFMSVVPLYLVAFPFLILFFGATTPVRPVEKKRLGLSRLILLIPVCIFIAAVGSFVGDKVSTALDSLPFFQTVNPVESLVNTNLLCAFICTVVIAPIMEELIFRKALLDRVSPAGEGFAIFLSALFFGAFHGNFSQFFYTFALGLLLAFVYLRTGRVIYTILLHMAFNFCGGFVSMLMSSDLELLESLAGVPTDEILFSDSVVRSFDRILNLVCSNAFLVVVGLIVFIMVAKELFTGARASATFTKRECRRAVWGNFGTWLMLFVCLVIFALNTLDLNYLFGLISSAA